MPIVTADLVKQLRDRTNHKMMACKKALDASNGDMDKAIDLLRIADPRTTVKDAETGVSRHAVAIGTGRAALISLACQTDFVSNNAMFKALCASIAQAALASSADSAQALSAISIGELTVQQTIHAAISKLGEQIRLTNVKQLVGSNIVAYDHDGKVVAVVAGSGDSKLLRNVAMHVASVAPAPVSLTRADVDSGLVAKERDIISATPDVASKPEAIRPKIVEGKLGRFYKENVLMEQEMQIDAESGTSVEQYAREKSLTITAFARLG